jgi:tetratricopeptide (TPR) repeat protein
MSPRFPVPRAAVLLVPVLALALQMPAGQAAAQPLAPPDTPHGQAIEPLQPPKDLPHPQRGDRTRNLDFLFGALKAAPDADSAKLVENRIWALWLASGSDTANLLMGRVKTATDGKDPDLAIRLLNSIIDIKPDYLEAWNRRATLYYMKKDFGPALADIRQVLAREPRHFGALSGLGIILQELGDDKGALEAFRRAVAIHPHLERIPDLVKKLTEKVEGREI